MSVGLFFQVTSYVRINHFPKEKTHPPTVKKLSTPHSQSPKHNASKISRSFKTQKVDQLSQHFHPQDRGSVEKYRNVESRVSVLKINISHLKMFC